MEKSGLRGLLLGVSLALLLSGGVAMAAASLSIEPWCGVCCDTAFLPDAAQVTPDCDDFWTMTTSGWGSAESLTFTLNSPGPRLLLPYNVLADESGQAVVRLYLMCWRGRDQLIHTSADGFDYVFILGGMWTEEDYGEWDVLVEGSEDSAEAAFYFAEDPGVCQAMEFVPEPGSVMLLGSGLAGLAGYAVLRLRSGQALRLR